MRTYISHKHSSNVVCLQAERARRGHLINTALLEAEFHLRTGVLASSAEEFARRCPGYSRSFRRAPDGSFDLNRNDFMAWAHIGRIRPSRVAKALRLRATAWLASGGHAA